MRFLELGHHQIWSSAVASARRFALRARTPGGVFVGCLCAASLLGCADSDDGDRASEDGAEASGDGAEQGAQSGLSGGSRADPDFEFDLEAVLGDWPTQSRVLESTCHSSVADPDWTGSGTTEIARENDLVIRVRRSNGRKLFGVVDGPHWTLEGDTGLLDGTGIHQKMDLVFSSLSRFEANTTLTVEPWEQDPEGCVAVVEDIGMR